MLSSQYLLGIADELVVDLFAGGGGASTGIELAIGRHVDIAINHDPEAVSLHEANHPQTRHFVSDVFEVDPHAVCGDQPVGLLWASPDCKHFWAFTRHVDEGGYTFDQKYVFLQQRGQLTDHDNDVYEVPLHTQDMISAFYFARTLDFGSAAKGDVFTVPCFVDGEYWTLQMKVMGRETIKLRNGRYRTIKFQPIVQEGRVFKTSDDLNVWVRTTATTFPSSHRPKCSWVPSRWN